MNPQLKNEKEVTLKGIRTDYLNNAGEMIARGYYDIAYEYLGNFTDSIPDNTDASDELKKLQDLCIEYKEREKRSVMKSVNGLNMETADVQKYNFPAIYRNTVRLYNEGCWRIALRYRLILME